MKDRISVVHNLDIEDFSNPLVNKGPNSINLVYSKYGNGDIYAESRPHLQVYSDEVPAGKEGYARGVYYWESAQYLISAVGDTVFQGAYGIPIGTLTSKRERLYFHEYSSTHLAIVDVEANDVYLLTNTNGVISGASLAPSLPSGLLDGGIAGGGVTLDGYLFLLNREGRIYNSAQGDINTWNELWYISAQRSVDFAVYLTKQGDHLVYIGSSSIEFFWNAGNPTGSVLARRSDISFNVGAGDHHQVYNNGTQIFFLGASLRGSFGVYKIQDFKLSYTSNDSVDKYIAEKYVTNPATIYILSCSRILEHLLVYITCVDPIENGPYIPKWTIVYDEPVQMFSIFTTKVYSDPLTSTRDVAFPIMDIAEKITSTVSGQTYQLLDGKLAIFRYSDTNADSSGFSYYVTDTGLTDGLREYVENQDGYVAQIGRASQFPIFISMTTQEYDADTYNYKVMNQFTVNGRGRPPFAPNPDINQESMNVYWSDDAYRTWSSPRTLNMKIPDRKLTRLGSFRRRAFRVDYSGSERLRITSFGVDLSTSEYK